MRYKLPTLYLVQFDNDPNFKGPPQIVEKAKYGIPVLYGLTTSPAMYHSNIGVCIRLVFEWGMHAFSCCLLGMQRFQ